MGRNLKGSYGTKLQVVDATAVRLPWMGSQVVDHIESELGDDRDDDIAQQCDQGDERVRGIGEPPDGFRNRDMPRLQVEEGGR